ncbi:MAG TPA: carbohydrate kinase family protein [Coriobacteriia bacterium]|nr:carbohydrate kinase family protein [Coriobacteriia bacterium]
MQQGSVRKIVVVGGANTDIAGRSTAPLVASDSNPGHISRSAGGVGRNIAENLARLGASVSLLTAFGDDSPARELAHGCSEIGIDISLCVTVPGVPGSVYLAVLDDTGDMAVAINDMRALDALTPATVLQRKAALNAAALVVLDANLPEKTIHALAEEIGAPLMLDPVSVAKAPRTRAVLPKLACVKCNAAEAEVLLNAAEGTAAADLAMALHEAGAAVAIVTDGPRGVGFASASESGHADCPQVTIANATGAGDAFSAGVAFALAEGHGAAQAVALGSALAALALESESTVSSRVTPDVVVDIRRSWVE